MASRVFKATDTKGLIPAIDPTQVDQIFALNGRNFVFDSRGPASVFGNRLLLPQPRSNPSQMEGVKLRLRTGDRVFHMDGDGVWEWDEEAGGYQAIYLTGDTSISPNRWTWGYLAGKMYFCHPSVGILVYDLDSETCLPHDEAGGIASPEQAIALVVNSGRLNVLTSEAFAWSDPSDGLNFTPSLGGGGFQLLSDRVAGEPITISGYSGGCLSWTTGGILRSEFTADAMVYRHRSLNTEYRPINSFCMVRIDDNTSVILDERGLFQSRGDVITPFTPLFNEFLLDYIQKNNLKVEDNVRIEWDDLQRRLYVSLSLSYANPLYETCFVLYPPLDQWGQFNEPHYGILPILIKGTERADDYYGFVDEEARVRYWIHKGNRQLSPSEASLDDTNLYHPAIQRAVQFDSGDPGVRVSSVGKALTFSRLEISQPADYYEWDATSPSTPQVKGLDALIQLGLFRPLGPDVSDHLSEIVNVLIRNIQSGDEDQVGMDFNLIPDATDDEDYNEVPGSEDYGVEALNYVNHKLRLIASIDGVTEFQSTEPELVAFVQGARYYACSVVGIWHIIEISADEIGESFHVQTCEITAVDAGRML